MNSSLRKVILTASVLLVLLSAISCGRTGKVSETDHPAASENSSQDSTAGNNTSPAESTSETEGAQTTAPVTGTEEETSETVETEETVPANAVFAAPDAPTFSGIFGVGRDELVSFLEAHENDGSYIGVPYRPGPFSFSMLGGAASGFTVSANKTKEKYSHEKGVAEMNCAGFVSNVIWQINDGFPAKFKKELSKIKGLGSGIKSWECCSAHNWKYYATGSSAYGLEGLDESKARMKYYAFDSKDEMMKSGVLKKGDIVLSFPCGKTGDSHIGFWWGSEKEPDVYWNSHPSVKVGGTTLGSDNGLTVIFELAFEPAWFIIPID